MWAEGVAEKDLGSLKGFGLGAAAAPEQNAGATSQSHLHIVNAEMQHDVRW